MDEGRIVGTVKIKVEYEFDLNLYEGDEPFTEEALLKYAREDFYGSVHDNSVIKNIRFEVREKMEL